MFSGDLLDTCRDLSAKGASHGCIFLKIREPGGGGRLRINLRKVKDLVNNASILAIFSLKLYSVIKKEGVKIFACNSKNI